MLKLKTPPGDMRELRQPLRLWLTDTVAPVVQAIFETFGKVAPMWHAVASDGTRIIYSPHKGDKDVAAASLRALFEMDNVVRCCHINEAWMLEGKGPITADVRRVFREGVKHHPQRVEVVMMNAEDQEAGLLMCHRVIDRPPGGKAHLGPLVVRDTDGVTEGRFIGLLPSKGAVQ